MCSAISLCPYPHRFLSHSHIHPPSVHHSSQIGYLVMDTDTVHGDEVRRAIGELDPTVVHCPPWAVTNRPLTSSHIPKILATPCAVADRSLTVVLFLSLFYSPILFLCSYELILFSAAGVMV